MRAFFLLLAICFAAALPDNTDVIGTWTTSNGRTAYVCARHPGEGGRLYIGISRVGNPTQITGIALAEYSEDGIAGIAYITRGTNGLESPWNSEALYLQKSGSTWVGGPFNLVARTSSSEPDAEFCLKTTDTAHSFHDTTFAGPAREGVNFTATYCSEAFGTFAYFNSTTGDALPTAGTIYGKYYDEGKIFMGQWNSQVDYKSGAELTVIIDSDTARSLYTWYDGSYGGNIAIYNVDSTPTCFSNGTDFDVELENLIGTWETSDDAQISWCADENKLSFATTKFINPGYQFSQVGYGYVGRLLNNEIYASGFLYGVASSPVYLSSTSFYMVYNQTSNAWEGVTGSGAEFSFTSGRSSNSVAKNSLCGKPASYSIIATWTEDIIEYGLCRDGTSYWEYENEETGVFVGVFLEDHGVFVGQWKNSSCDHGSQFLVVSEDGSGAILEGTWYEPDGTFGSADLLTVRLPASCSNDRATGCELPSTTSSTTGSGSGTTESGDAVSLAIPAFLVMIFACILSFL